MGALRRIHSLLCSLLLDVYYFVRLGIRRSTILKICRDLSNLYLTPTNPGLVTTDAGMHAEIVTSMPMMRIDINGSYFLDRKELVVKLSWDEDIPLWDSRVRPVLQLFKHFSRNGVRIPPNNEGVTYFRMPGEEDFDAGTA